LKIKKLEVLKFFGSGFEISNRIKCFAFRQRVIPFDKAKEEADQLGVILFETSALNGSNIDDIFKALVVQIKQEQDDLVSISASGEITV
jgi:hypothetical protein